MKTRNRENMVRVHLKQAILVGYGEKARYTKVLIGEHEVIATDYHGQTFMTVVVIGYVHGYQGYSLDEPTRMGLATGNILCIEDAKVEHEDCRRAHAEIETVYCSQVYPHAPHHWQKKPRTVHCPGAVPGAI